MVSGMNLSIPGLIQDPFLIGFNREIDKLNAIRKNHNSSASYPRYNIVKTGSDNYILEVALAGFSRDDIKITVDDGILSVSGEKKIADDRVYVVNGIAARKFTKSFALGEFMEVNSAEMKDGILSICVDRVIPEDKKPKEITIK